MAFDIDRLAPQRPFESSGIDPHGKASKQHFPHRHLIDDGVEPFDEQQLEIGRLAAHLDRDLRRDLRMGDDGRQRLGRLLERLRRGRAPPSHADVGIVREMLPSRLAFGRRGGTAHNRSRCFPSSFTVLACGPFSPISSANVTCVPTARRLNAPSSTLLR